MNRADENNKKAQEGVSADEFMKVYNNLPLEEREQTIIVIDDEPVSWKMAKREITEDTQLGQKISKELKKLDIV